jgi:hypothetical protein
MLVHVEPALSLKQSFELGFLYAAVFSSLGRWSLAVVEAVRLDLDDLRRREKARLPHKEVWHIVLFEELLWPLLILCPMTNMAPLSCADTTGCLLTILTALLKP